ncbi:hypothetical protein JCM10449v2_002135 [Rhodotorula kratochvilovae]
MPIFASSSSAALLPAVGTVFPSSTHLKLAAQRIALAYNLELKVDRSNERQLWLRCRVPAASSTGTAAPCTFALYAQQRSDVDLRYEVRSKMEEHSCAAEARRARTKEARVWTERKIDEYEAALAELGLVSEGKTPGTKRGKATESVGDDEAGDADEVVRRASSRARRSMVFYGRGADPTRNKGGKCGREDSEDEDYELSSEEEGQGRAASERFATGGLYPQLKDFVDEVDKLAENGPIALPSSDATFPSSRALLVRLYAHARTHGFTLQRSGKNDNPRKFRIRCSLGHERHANAPGGRCGYRVVAERGAGGRWALTTAETTHNHPLGGGTVRGPKRPPRKEARRTTLGAALAPAITPEPVAHPASTSAATSGATMGSFLPSHAASLPSPAQPTLPHREPFFLPDLTAFLAATLPSVPGIGNAHELARALHRAGIDSREALGTLVLFDIGTQRHFLGGLVAGGEVDAWSATALVGALQEARAGGWA